MFYDHLLVFQEINLEIKRSARAYDEKEEVWKLIDEIVHHHVMICILEELPSKHHKSFLEKFHSSPYDTGIIDFLNEKTGSDMEKLIAEKIISLEKDILQELRDK